MLNLENGNEFNVDTIRNALKEEINNSDYARFLEVAKLKDETISIRAKKTVVARIRFSDKESNIEIRSKYSAILPHGQVQRAEGEEEWTNIPIISMDDILARKKELAEIFMMVLADMGGERYGCCSRYLLCSDEKKCVNPDQIMALACAYKKNLEAGIIFYGKNKTI